MDTASTTSTDYRALAERVRSAGLLERRRWYYALRIGLTLAGFATGWLLLFVVGDSWAALGVAALLGVLFTQVVFLGHDAGHQQIFKSKRANWILGLVVGNLLTGLSFGWWVPKHNAHHAHPNQVGRDPDIGPGAISSEWIAGAARQHRGLRRLLERWRVVLATPLILFEIGMHLSSTKALLARRDRQAALEWFLLTLNAAAYLAIVFVVLSPLRAVAFIAVQQLVFGVYLRICFAPNHKGMPIIADESALTFVERQVITSRNVRGGALVTFLLGGLNFQIEHHLFPTMPRPNLAPAQVIIRAFCAECGLNYEEASMGDSYQRAFNSLRGRGTVEDDHSPVVAPTGPEKGLANA